MNEDEAELIPGRVGPICRPVPQATASEDPALIEQSRYGTNMLSSRCRPRDTDHQIFEGGALRERDVAQRNAVLQSRRLNALTPPRLNRAW